VSEELKNVGMPAGIPNGRMKGSERGVHA
jgi:hypothetical protein